MEHFRELSGRLQQAQLPLLTREVGIQEGHPFVVFIESRLFHVAKSRITLIELRLQELKILLRKLEVQPRYFACSIEFADGSGSLLHFQTDLLALRT